MACSFLHLLCIFQAQLKCLVSEYLGNTDVRKSRQQHWRRREQRQGDQQGGHDQSPALKTWGQDDGGGGETREGGVQTEQEVLSSAQMREGSFFWA